MFWQPAISVIPTKNDHNALLLLWLSEIRAFTLHGNRISVAKVDLQKCQKDINAHANFVIFVHPGKDNELLDKWIHFILESKQ